MSKITYEEDTHFDIPGFESSLGIAGSTGITGSTTHTMQVFDIDHIPQEIKSTIAQRQQNGFYKLVGDVSQKDHYKVANRSAPILAQTSPDVRGIRAVSDSVAYVPEDSLTEQNQGAFAHRAAYLDKHRLGATGMAITMDQVMAQEKTDEKPCVRIDPCPDPPFKDLQCCSLYPSPDAALEAKMTSEYGVLKVRDYGHKDSTWSFMVDRPYDKYAMIIMGVTVGVAVFCVCVLLIWAMVTATKDK